MRTIDSSDQRAHIARMDDLHRRFVESLPPTSRNDAILKTLADIDGLLASLAPSLRAHVQDAVASHGSSCTYKLIKSTTRQLLTNDETVLTLQKSGL